MQSQNTSFVASMLHEIKATLRGEPHTFTEIRTMIEDARIGEYDLVEILLQHHRFLNESVIILMDDASPDAEKQMHMSRFLTLLDMHGRAEEETLYRSLIRHSQHDVIRHGLVCQDEHEIAFKLASDLRAMPFVTEWSDDADAKAKVLASLVHHHMVEEEKFLFPIARKALLPNELLVLANDYLDVCEFNLDGEQRLVVPTLVSWPLNL